MSNRITRKRDRRQAKRRTSQCLIALPLVCDFRLPEPEPVPSEPVTIPSPEEVQAVYASQTDIQADYWERKVANLLAERRAMAEQNLDFSFGHDPQLWFLERDLEYARRQWCSVQRGQTVTATYAVRWHDGSLECFAVADGAGLETSVHVGDWDVCVAQAHSSTGCWLRLGSLPGGRIVAVQRRAGA